MKNLIFVLCIYVIALGLLTAQEFPITIVSEEESNLVWNYNNIVNDSINIICYTKNYESSTFLYLQFLDFNGNLLLGEQGVLVDSTGFGDIKNYTVCKNLDNTIFISWTVAQNNSYQIRLKKANIEGELLSDDYNIITPYNYTGSVEYLKTVPDLESGLYYVWNDTFNSKIRFCHYSSNSINLSYMDSYNVSNFKINNFPEDNMTLLIHNSNNLKFYKLDHNCNFQLMYNYNNSNIIEQINFFNTENSIYLIFNNLYDTSVFIKKFDTSFSTLWSSLLPLPDNVDVQKFFLKKESYNKLYAVVFFKNTSFNSSGVLYKIDDNGQMLYVNGYVEVLDDIVDAYYSHFSLTSNDRNDIAVLYPFYNITDECISLKLKIVNNTGFVIDEKVISSLLSNSKFLCSYNNDKLFVIWANQFNFLKFNFYDSSYNPVMEKTKYLNSDLFIYNPKKIQTYYDNQEYYHILFSSFNGNGSNFYYQLIHSFTPQYPNPIKINNISKNTLDFHLLKSSSDFGDNSFTYLDSNINNRSIYIKQATNYPTSQNYTVAQFISTDTHQFFVSQFYNNALFFWEVNNNVYCQKFSDHPEYSFSGNLILENFNIVDIKENVILLKSLQGYYVYFFDDSGLSLMPDNNLVYIDNINEFSENIKLTCYNNNVFLTYINPIGNQLFLQLTYLNLSNNFVINRVIDNNLIKKKYIVIAEENLFIAYNDNEYKVKGFDYLGNNIIEISEMNLDNQIPNRFNFEKFFINNHYLTIVLKDSDQILILNRNLSFVNSLFETYYVNSFQISNVYDILTVNGNDYYICTKTLYDEFPSIKCIYLQNLQALTNEPYVNTTLNSLNNYPNPFNPSTKLSFSLDKASDVKLTVYNIKGQKVNDIFSGYLNSGKHEYVWNGTDQNGNNVSSGIYFTRIESSNGVYVRKMMMIK